MAMLKLLGLLLSANTTPNKKPATVIEHEDGVLNLSTGKRELNLSTGELGVEGGKPYVVLSLEENYGGRPHADKSPYWGAFTRKLADGKPDTASAIKWQKGFSPAQIEALFVKGMVDMNALWAVMTNYQPINWEKYIGVDFDEVADKLESRGRDVEVFGKFFNLPTEKNGLAGVGIAKYKAPNSNRELESATVFVPLDRMNTTMNILKAFGEQYTLIALDNDHGFRQGQIITSPEMIQQDRAANRLKGAGGPNFEPPKETKAIPEDADRLADEQSADFLLKDEIEAIDAADRTNEQNAQLVEIDARIAAREVELAKK